MEAFMPLLLLTLCASGLSEPLSEAMQRRRGSGSIYAHDYTHNYEPFVFAAFPLHAPVPVVHVLSPGPLTSPKDIHYASSVRHSTYTEPTYAYDYDSDYSEPQQYSHRLPIHATSLPHLMYANPLPTQESAPTILYARPNSQGGYTYHKRPLQPRTQPKRSPPKEESPVILRVHKVRVIRSR